MTSLRQSMFRPGSIGAGSLLGLSAITPAFAATFDSPLPPRDMLLYGSLVLLAVGLAARLMRARRQESPATTQDMQDMRWWHGADPQT